MSLAHPAYPHHNGDVDPEDGAPFGGFCPHCEADLSAVEICVSLVPVEQAPYLIISGDEPVDMQGPVQRVPHPFKLCPWCFAELTLEELLHDREKDIPWSQLEELAAEAQLAGGDDQTRPGWHWAAQASTAGWWWRQVPNDGDGFWLLEVYQVLRGGRWSWRWRIWRDFDGIAIPSGAPLRDEPADGQGVGMRAADLALAALQATP